ncbi:MAG TPA: LacI family DNA-binding transcriptional regulator [Bryobacteraceae bacterium]|jgi:DNA-binding LacI/PurR family transcriptional regulator
MKDIAARARVSIGTVSRVLNRHADVDQELRERVELAVRKLGYRLNQRTRAVVHSKSRIIGLILCNDFGLNAAQSLLLLGVEEHCAQAGYYLLFARHNFAPGGKTVPLPNVIETPGLADCVILVGALDERVLQVFEQHDLHSVLLANHVQDAESNGRCQVRYDDEGGCYEATRYLAQLGHRHIWFVGDESRLWHRSRYKGYARAMSELDLEQHVHTIALSDDEFENGHSAVSYILEQQWPLTAILAASDELAFGAREGLRQHRKEVPKDVSLVGFENQSGRSRGSNLTSVSVDMAEVGRQLARLAIARIEANEAQSREVVVPATFVKRSTCRPLRMEEHMLL